MTAGALARSWLFTPGDRPDRFATPRTRAADAVILDLEDAVAPDDKPAARAAVAGHLRAGGRAWVRVNGADTPAHDDDLAALAGLRGLLGVVLPKAEGPDRVRSVADRLEVPVLAIVETPAGVLDAPATAGAATRLALGSVDLMTALGVADQQALAHARSVLVLASAAAGLPGPVDGPTTALDDPAVLDADLRRARALGFTGAFCLHPGQVDAVNAAHTPSPEAVERARRTVEAATGAGGGDGRAVRVDGAMVDAPALAAARAVLARADALPAPAPTDEESR